MNSGLLQTLAKLQVCPTLKTSTILLPQILLQILLLVCPTLKTSTILLPQILLQILLLVCPTLKTSTILLLQILLQILLLAIADDESSPIGRSSGSSGMSIARAFKRRAKRCDFMESDMSLCRCCDGDRRCARLSNIRTNDERFWGCLMPYGFLY